MKRILTLGALVAILAGWAAPALAQNGYVVVVNQANGTTAMTADEVSRLFLKRTTAWTDGTEVLPVDQSEAAAARASFSEDVHGKSVAAIKSYWQRQIFSGRGVPPTEKTSDEDVLAYVRTSPGAVGYVRAGTPLGNGVKQLRISDR